MIVQAFGYNLGELEIIVADYRQRYKFEWGPVELERFKQRNEKPSLKINKIEGNKMKFAEAMQNLNSLDVSNKPISETERNFVLLKKLEALGLLKFEPEPDTNNEAAVAMVQIINNVNLDGPRWSVSYGWAIDLLNKLEKKGFKVVKNEN